MFNKFINLSPSIRIISSCIYSKNKICLITWLDPKKKKMCDRNHVLLPLYASPLCNYTAQTHVSLSTSSSPHQSHESRRPASRLRQRRGGRPHRLGHWAGSSRPCRASRVRYRLRCRVHVLPHYPSTFQFTLNKTSVVLILLMKISDAGRCWICGCSQMRVVAEDGTKT